MLPFFAAGGAISGSSFGLFYTILMQVGYNYFGKRVLKGLNEGGNLKQLLWEVQQEIQPFSDSMLQMALDSLPSVLENSIDAFVNLVKRFGEARAQEIAQSWLLPPQLRGGMPSGSQAGMLAYAPYLLREHAGVKGGVPPSVGVSSAEKARIAALQLSARDVQQRADMKAAAERVSARGMLQDQVRAGTVKRPANQSVILSRKMMIQQISDFASKIKIYSARGDQVTVTQLHTQMRLLQQKLKNLYERYYF